MFIELKIRQLRSSDYGTVRRIEEAILDEYRQYLKRTGEIDEVPSGIQPTYFNYYVRTKTSFAALVDGEVVGFVLSKPMFFADGEKKILWLDYIAVQSKFRRKGIGTSLLSKVERWATQHSCNVLYTTLNPNNTPSRLLLDRKGFAVRNWMKAVKEL